MRDNAARIGIAAAAGAAPPTLFFVFSDSDLDSDLDAVAAQPSSAESDTDSQSPSAQITSQPTDGQGSSEDVAPAPERPAVERIVVKSGEPVGGVRRLEYERGERVRFTVRVDSSDEVHVHGFDIQRAVPANGIVLLGFPASIEGIFEVELHHAHGTIAELRIGP